LGRIFEDGLGVARDRAEAVHWYRLAAQQGDHYATTALRERLGVDE
jgi:TPR repeat protein